MKRWSVKAESSLEWKSVLPLIFVWEGEKLHPRGAAQGFGVSGHAWKPRSSRQGRRVERGKRFDKVKSANSPAEGAAPAHWKV